MRKKLALLCAAVLLFAAGAVFGQAARAFPYEVFVLDVAPEAGVEGVAGLHTSPQATKAVNALSSRGYSIDLVFPLEGARVGLLTHRS